MSTTYHFLNFYKKRKLSYNFGLMGIFKTGKGKQDQPIYLDHYFLIVLKPSLVLRQKMRLNMVEVTYHPAKQYLAG